MTYGTSASSQANAANRETALMPSFESMPKPFLTRVVADLVSR